MSAPTSAEARHALGLALLDAGETAAGIDALATALRLRPGLVEARIRLVEALQAEDRLAEALAVLKAAG